MDQIPVGGATAQFSTLHPVLFDGYILIKKDCRKLQELAPYAAIEITCKGPRRPPELCLFRDPQQGSTVPIP